MLTDREAGRKFGVFISVYHEIMLVMLCRLQGYTLSGANVLSWLNGDVELAMQLLLGVLKVKAYEVQLCANCVAIMLDFATPSAYFSSAASAGSDGSTAQHSVQDFLRHADKLQRIIMSIGGVRVITECLARHLHAAERATLEGLGRPRGEAQPAAILPAPYLRGTIHFMRFVHLLYTYAGSHVTSGEQSSATVGFRQHILVTTDMAQALLIPHLRVSGLLWRFAATRGVVPPALLGGPFVRAASLVMRTLAMVSFRAVAASVPLMRVNPCTAFLDGLQAVTHGGDDAQQRLPPAAANTMFALLCAVQVNWDALAPHPPDAGANEALVELATRRTAPRTANSGPQPIKTANSGPQPIGSRASAGLSPLDDWPVTCKPAALTGQLQRALGGDEARRQAVLHTLTAPSWMPLSRDHFSYDVLVGMAAGLEVGQETPVAAAASAAGGVASEPQPSTERLPAALKTVGITWNPSTNPSSKSAVASLAPLRTPPSACSDEHGMTAAGSQGSVSGTSAAAARHAARERERKQREAVAAGIDLSKHQVQSSVASRSHVRHTAGGGVRDLSGPTGLQGPTVPAAQKPESHTSAAIPHVAGLAVDSEPRPEFLCALTGSVMRIPVVAQVDLSAFLDKEAKGIADLSVMRRREKVQRALQRSGGVVRYEEEAILGWLAQRGSVDPLTGGELTPDKLHRDTDMQQCILEWQVASSMASQAADSGHSDSKAGEEDFDGDALYDF
mgnify:CR=1 FL=1